MQVIIKCEGCGKELLEGDIFSIAGQLTIKVVPCGCKAEPVDNCLNCEDLEANKIKMAELTEDRDRAQRELAELREKVNS